MTNLRSGDEMGHEKKIISASTFEVKKDRLCNNQLIMKKSSVKGIHDVTFCDLLR